MKNLKIFLWTHKAKNHSILHVASSRRSFSSLLKLHPKGQNGPIFYIGPTFYIGLYRENIKNTCLKPQWLDPWYWAFKLWPWGQKWHHPRKCIFCIGLWENIKKSCQKPQYLYVVSSSGPLSNLLKLCPLVKNKSSLWAVSRILSICNLDLWLQVKLMI